MFPPELPPPKVLSPPSLPPSSMFPPQLPPPTETSASSMSVHAEQSFELFSDEELPPPIVVPPTTYQCSPLSISKSSSHSQTTSKSPLQLTQYYKNDHQLHDVNHQVPGAPSCYPIEGRKKNTSLPSIEISKENLIPYEVVMKKFRNLHKENTIGKLAIKLARLSFFGYDVMRKCTVMGCREFPALPVVELQALKQAVFELFPTYWNNHVEFESKIWNTCVTSIGQACKRARAEQGTEL